MEIAKGKDCQSSTCIMCLRESKVASVARTKVSEGESDRKRGWS